MKCRFFAKLIVTVSVAIGMIGSASAATLTVGGKNFTEQYIMASMTTQLLEANGYEIDKRDGMGSTVVRKAQLNGQVDLYWEYTGTSLITYNKKDSKGLSQAETIDKVRELDKEKGLVWLACSDANNTYALGVRDAEFKTADLQSISDLANAYNNGQNLKIALDAEFAHRPDGLPGLEKAYDFNVPRPDREMMGLGLTYGALKDENVDVAMVFATDGRIEAFDFRVLKDDRQFFPNYAMCPVVRKETLDAHPDLRKLLESLSATLDDATMRKLNKKVDVDEMSAQEVAHEYLQQKDML